MKDFVDAVDNALRDTKGVSVFQAAANAETIMRHIRLGCCHAMLCIGPWCIGWEDESRPHGNNGDAYPSQPLA